MDFIKELSILIMLGVGISADAHEFTYQGLRYSVRDETGKTVRLAAGDNDKGANTYTGYLSIPETVWDGDTKYTVYEVGRHSFKGCETITGVKIPDTVREINASAFEDCWNITEAIIGSGVKIIDDQAFYGCSSLAGIDIPDGVEELGVMAFGQCWRMQYVTLGVSLEKVTWEPFDGCIGVKRVEANCKTIAKEWFADCKGLRELVTGDRMATIADGAFRNFTNLERVTFGAALNRIGADAFAGCTRLAEITANSTTPPAISESTFSQATYDTATLTVRPSAEEVYRQSPYWGKFFADSGVADILDDTHGLKVEGSIIINRDNRPLVIYSTAGNIMYRGSDPRISHLPSGTYILVIDGQSYKLHF